MAEENEDGQEKTEEPSSKKLQDAKEKGDVPRSKELGTTLILIAGAVGLMTTGRDIGEGLSEMMSEALTIDRRLMFEPSLMLTSAIDLLIHAFVLIIPLVVILLVAIFLNPLMLGGFAFSGEKLKPKLSNMSPIKGMKRLFGAEGLMELFKSILKILLIGGAAVWLIMSLFNDILMFSHLDFKHAYAKAVDMIAWFFLVVCSTVIVIAAIDVPFQKWNFKKKQRMTKKEVKEERKSTEGSPEVKQKIRGLQMEATMRRMMEQVPKADVVITNPTHFAVALQYKEDKMAAPILLAKGADLVATNIRELAQEHEIPIVSAPPLARAIYHTTEIDDEIPASLYLAVAQILAYIYQLKRATAAGVTPPDFPSDLDVPDGLDKGYKPH